MDFGADCDSDLYPWRDGGGGSALVLLDSLAAAAGGAAARDRAVQHRQQLRPVRCDDENPTGNRRRRQRRSDQMGAVRVQMESRRHQAPPALLRAAHAAARLADVVSATRSAAK